MASATDGLDPIIDTRIWQLAELTVMGVRGQLDVFSAVEFQRRAQEALASGSRTFIIDLTGVSHVDGSGVNALIAISRVAKSAGIILGTVARSPQLRRLSALVGIECAPEGDRSMPTVCRPARAEFLRT